MKARLQNLTKFLHISHELIETFIFFDESIFVLKGNGGRVNKYHEWENLSIKDSSSVNSKTGKKWEYRTHVVMVCSRTSMYILLLVLMLNI